MDSNSNPHSYAPSFCRLSQAYLTNPIGLPSYYPRVVKIQVVGLLDFHRTIPFGLARCDSTEPAEVLPAIALFDRGYLFAPIERRRMHSRFETNWFTDTFVYETRSEFGAASSLRGEAR
jgi:hypothetical protein